jgi:hypothetical protein
MKKNMGKFFFILKVTEEGAEYGSGSNSQGYGSADLDLDPQQNVTDPQHQKYQF